MHRSFFSHFVQRTGQAVYSFVHIFGNFFHHGRQIDSRYFHFDSNMTGSTVAQRRIVFGWMGRRWRSWRRRFGGRLPTAATG